ncbi:hypothetical protein HYV12_04275 [Candidatus Dojkabacteria bacterium]|nr:hypothetical protein [Candidatus Dojkabacteria bacterium]
MRDNHYLNNLLETIWDGYFQDVPRANLVTIGFGRRSYRQLGAIKSRKGDTSISNIVLTGYFTSLIVPEFVLVSTIGHELVHYSHGFNSPLPKLYSDPHRGNIVDKDMIRRGLHQELNDSKLWLAENWSNIIEVRPRRRRYSRRKFLIFSF